jgi:hypothetical protein
MFVLNSDVKILEKGKLLALLDGKVTFISIIAECLYQLSSILNEFSYKLLAPQFSHGGGSTPTVTAIAFQG